MGTWSENILQKLNYRHINRFNACWVPDEEGENNLAGSLSHPEKKPLVPLHYIGPLSRFEIKKREPIKNHLLVLLSGPEPQRTLQENKIIDGISHYQGTATVIRGLPGNLSIIPSTNMIKFYNHLPAAELETCLQDAEYVIGRCGYSTIMDVMALQKKTILVPTPGQTEQEYLAGYLAKKQMICVVDQKEFNLDKALSLAREFPYRFPAPFSENKRRNLIRQFVSSLH